MGVALLTLTAPAAWIAARGALDTAGVKVWLLNVLFFLGGVLYVKYRVRGLLAHRPFCSARERLSFAWPVFLYHLLLVAFLAGWVVLDLQPAAVMLAFVPGILRASGLLFQLGRRFAIPRLGWRRSSTRCCSPHSSSLRCAPARKGTSPYRPAAPKPQRGERGGRLKRRGSTRSMGG